MASYSTGMTAALFALCAGCAAPPAAALVAGEGKRVLVIANAADPASVRLARYYLAKRGVPKENLVLLKTTTSEELPQSAFAKEIEAPVKAALARTKNPVDFLLLIRGVPIRVAEGGDSVDSRLMSSGLKLLKIQVGEVAPNPYFGKDEPFTHAKFGIYLACRLDGYTAADAQALVDRSLKAKPNKGPFLLDEADNRKAESYGQLQGAFVPAAQTLTGRGLTVELDREVAFALAPKPLAGYVSWGSNDGAFSIGVYRSLRFLPGAISETFVSTSGRTFRDPNAPGQSLVGDLIAQGVTGVKGYVSEPYTLALARPDLLFDRYTKGRNLAESFYAASPVTHWKDVVIGDPLCAPYRR